MLDIYSSRTLAGNRKCMKQRYHVSDMSHTRGELSFGNEFLPFNQENYCISFVYWSLFSQV